MAVGAQEKMVLACPQGGFNDMLCQLERAWRYCRRFNRALVVETGASGLNDDLFRYFELRRSGPVPILAPSDLGWRIRLREGQIQGEAADATPLFAQGAKLGDTFDMGADHADPVLLHATAGGGDLGVHFLEKLALRPEIKAQITSAIAPLGQDYLSIHIRNTDWQTDYVSAFRSIERLIEGRKVLVCSDDSRSLLYFQDTYGTRCSFATTSELGNLDGKPLHHGRSGDAYAANLRMLTDLYALASGARIVMVDTQNTKRSGFAVLAAHMLRRLRPLDGDGAFDLGGRLASYRRALLRGRPMRVYRAREIRPGRHLCHPTYE
ncbi:hypothetical protein AIOL_000284 [Candidatus Rhodobacter oscarellae]|uniref:Uncharacterized protein n=1 Tax=Candidatus Rhodobacter oscarellae TaxID=1675527 RepID=A0A0J9EBY9_9RHOB|nr:hypothetical protein [Candidatus Rhodobacter lobularis]KMW60131.1 hypothetical protein AIOL_000284 [Candidatus Rhodobacter lobularis]